jgi:autotransporter strand-loop-strand O-heptosyltransferase
MIGINYCEGCHISIKNEEKRIHKIIIKDGDKILFLKETTDSFISYEPLYDFYKFINYKVEIYSGEKLIYSENINLKGKNVKINFDSSALGDNIAWIAQVDRFQKKWQCNVYVNCQWKDLFAPVYPNLIFNDFVPEKKQNTTSILPGLENLSCKRFFCYQRPCSCYQASFDLGFYARHPNLKNMTLSQIACELLGLDYEDVVPEIWIENPNKRHNKKYVCIATQSTAQYKYWNNPDGWQKVCEYLMSIGYDVICIDKFDNYGMDGWINKVPSGIVNKTGDLPLQDRITDILHCEFFIGLSSGLSWLAWSLKKPVIMISGFSNPITEFENPYRVFNPNVCNSCWNDVEIKFPKKWNFCPRKKNYECSKEITADIVIKKIEKCIEDITSSEGAYH